MSMKEKVNVLDLDGWEGKKQKSFDFFPLTPVFENWKLSFSREAKAATTARRRRTKIHKIFFPFASHFNFTIGICSRDEKRTFLDELFFIDNTLFTCFALLRNFLFWHESIRRRRWCVIETVFCDTELLNRKKDASPVGNLCGEFLLILKPIENLSYFNF